VAGALSAGIPPGDLPKNSVPRARGEWSTGTGFVVSLRFGRYESHTRRVEVPAGGKTIDTAAGRLHPGRLSPFRFFGLRWFPLSFATFRYRNSGFGHEYLANGRRNFFGRLCFVRSDRVWVPNSAATTAKFLERLFRRRRGRASMAAFPKSQIGWVWPANYRPDDGNKLIIFYWRFVRWNFSNSRNLRSCGPNGRGREDGF